MTNVCKKCTEICATSDLILCSWINAEGKSEMEEIFENVIFAECVGHVKNSLKKWFISM